jgi:hypothetical protein
MVGGAGITASGTRGAGAPSTAVSGARVGKKPAGYF